MSEERFCFWCYAAVSVGARQIDNPYSGIVRSQLEARGRVP